MLQNCPIRALSIHFFEYTYLYSKIVQSGTLYTFFQVHVLVLPNCSIGALSIHFLEYMYSIVQNCSIGALSIHFLEYMYSIVQNCSIGALSIHFLEYMYSYSQIVQSGHFLYIFWSTCIRTPKLFNQGTFYTHRNYSKA
jgi:hypothetical protein